MRYDTEGRPKGGGAPAPTVKYLADGTPVDPPSSGGVSDGDKGDITVSGGGGTWTIDPNTVTNAKLRDSVAASLMGRSENSAGDPGDIAAVAADRVPHYDGTDIGWRQVNEAAIADNAASNVKLADMAAWKIKARNAGTTGDPSDVAAGDLTAGTPGSGDQLLGWESTGELRKFDVGSLPAGPISFVKKTSDQALTGNTLVDVTGLTFSLVENHYYYFKFVVLYRSATATVGIQLATQFGSTPTRFGARGGIMIAADGAGGELQGPSTASDDSVVGTAVAVTNTDYIAIFEGVFVVAAAGDTSLELRAANETNTNNVTVRQGSMGMLVDLGT